ncbi:histone acetyltransferase of the CBP family 5 [Perilla frutescens var. frutescens]|nr:histone acetyltransferase of the CBP family 5 [Perilla frutescens var. frutescens]
MNGAESFISILTLPPNEERSPVSSPPLLCALMLPANFLYKHLEGRACEEFDITCVFYFSLAPPATTIGNHIGMY